MIKDTSIEYVKSKRGAKILLYDGYSYTLRRVATEKSIWRFRNRKCEGIIVTNSNDRILKEIPHNHAQSFEENESLYIKYVIKERSIHTSELLRDFVDIGIKNVSNKSLIHLNKYKNLRKIVSKTRNKLNIIISNDNNDIP
ncbi:hypothetical protein DMUE_5379 [Dictyocoela muelleri]|nr:hypothetical protein DMUE_5379 [Dictyocoela muelleri]